MEESGYCPIFQHNVMGATLYTERELFQFRLNISQTVHLTGTCHWTCIKNATPQDIFWLR